MRLKIETNLKHHLKDANTKTSSVTPLQRSDIFTNKIDLILLCIKMIMLFDPAWRGRMQ